MKNKLIPIFLIIVSICLGGCSLKANDETENNILETVRVIGNVSENGDYEYIDLKVNSIKIMKDRVEGLNTAPFEYLPDIYKISQNGEILCDKVFIAVTLSLYSDKDMKVGICGCRLEGNKNSLECYYNDSPIDAVSLKERGYTQLSANNEKIVTIGFFADEKMLELPEFTFVPVIIYTDEKTPEIRIENPDYNK